MKKNQNFMKVGLEITAAQCKPWNFIILSSLYKDIYIYIKLIGPLEIWMDIYISTFQASFSVI